MRGFRQEKEQTQNKNNRKSVSMDTLCRHLLETVKKAHTHLRARELIIATAQQQGVSIRRVKQAVKDLMAAEKLAYTTVFGSTCIEPAFAAPVRITRHFTLYPPGKGPGISPEEMAICIEPGTAFGTGRHPTTRLSLAAIEHALVNPGLGREQPKGGRALDVGTGSGVLALALIRAGMSHCLALDTDAVCVAQARRNVAFNHLEKHITIHHGELTPEQATLPGHAVVCANLRFPTLKALASRFYEVSLPETLFILSGIRPEELPLLIDYYQDLGCHRLWQSQEKNWAAVILGKKQ